MALSLLFYVRSVKGMEGWGGFTRRAFHNWGPFLKLATPGVLMVEAEFFAFEVLTLFASRFGTSALAAQSVIASLSSLLFQSPFALGIVASVRVAHYVGAGLIQEAKTTSNATLLLGIALGNFNLLVLVLVRTRIGLLFTSDDNVNGISDQPALSAKISANLTGRDGQPYHPHSGVTSTRRCPSVCQWRHHQRSRPAVYVRLHPLSQQSALTLPTPVCYTPTLAN